MSLLRLIGHWCCSAMQPECRVVDEMASIVEQHLRCAVASSHHKARMSPDPNPMDVWQPTRKSWCFIQYSMNVIRQTLIANVSILAVKYWKVMELFQIKFQNFVNWKNGKEVIAMIWAGVNDYGIGLWAKATHFRRHENGHCLGELGVVTLVA